MPRGHRGSVVPAQHPQHGDAQAGDGVPQQALVAGRADPVEDDTGQAHPPIPGGEAVHHGRGRAARGGRVHDQHDRGGGQPGRMGGRGEVRGLAGPRHRHPVEQAHHPFDDGDVGAVGAVGEQGADAFLAAEHGVEVAPGAAGGQGVVARVDVVRADLVRGDPQAAGGQGGHQPGRHGGLARAAGRGRDQQPGQDDAGAAHHSIPRWPFWPASIGCFTLVISVTRSAASSSCGGAARPVMTTCWRPGRVSSVSTTSATSSQPHFSG